MVKRRGLLTVMMVLLTISMFLVSCGKKEDHESKGDKETKKSFERGNAYYKLGKIDEAIKEYEETVLYEKTHKMAHYNLAVLYKEKERYREAIHEFEEYLKYSSEDDEEVVRKYVTEEIKGLKKKLR